MFELEYLVAFGIGAGLVALTPVAASVAGRESGIQNHFWSWSGADQAESQARFGRGFEIFWSFLKHEVRFE